MKSNFRLFAILGAISIAAIVFVLVVSQKAPADAPRDPVAQPNPENVENDRSIIAGAPGNVDVQHVAIADYLPGDTFGLISIHDAAPLVRILWETGMADGIASDYCQPVQDRVKAFQEYAGRIRSFHLAIKEFRPGIEPPPFLLIAETGLADSVGALPEIILEDLIPDGATHEIEIFRVRMNELSVGIPGRAALFGPESLLFAAGHEGVLWIGNNRRFLEESISLRVGDVPASLARTESYQSLSTNALDGSANIFVSVPGILRLIEFDMNRGQRDRFRNIAEFSGLRNIQVGGVVINGDNMTIRLKVDDRDRFSFIRPPAAGPGVLADFVTEESIIFIAYRFDDAHKHFKEFMERLFEMMLANEQVGSRREFEESMREIEEDIGFSFVDITAVIANEIAYNVRRDGGRIDLLEVKDVDRAKEMVRRYLQDYEFITHTIDGIELHVSGERHFAFSWAAIDNVIIDSSNQRDITAVIRARNRNLTLSRYGPYRKLVERLPAVNSVHLYMDVFSLISENTGDRHLEKMPAELRRWLEGLKLAASMNIDGDIIEFRLVSSDGITEELIQNIVGTIVEKRVEHDEILKEIMARPIRVIDVETLEVFEVTLVDYELKFERDPATGYKIDHRGRKIAVPMTCATCREHVPPAPIPADIGEDEFENILMNYRCPRCAERVYGM